jgi:hypothetical protein
MGYVLQITTLQLRSLANYDASIGSLANYDAPIRESCKIASSAGYFARLEKANYDGLQKSKQTHVLQVICLLAQEFAIYFYLLTHSGICYLFIFSTSAWLSVRPSTCYLVHSKSAHSSVYLSILIIQRHQVALWYIRLYHFLALLIVDTSEIEK